MPALLAQALGAILRHLLTALAGYFVTKGIWTTDEATNYIAAAAAALLALGWSIWSKYKGRIRLLTALDMPEGATEDALKARVDWDKQTGGTP